MRLPAVLGLALGTWSGTGIAADSDAEMDQRIRRIVGDMMKEKDMEIAGLKARVQELESQLRQLAKTPANLESGTAKPASGAVPPKQTAGRAAPPAPAQETEAAAAKPARDDREMRKLKKDVEELKQVEESRLRFNGFFAGVERYPVRPS